MLRTLELAYCPPIKTTNLELTHLDGCSRVIDP